MNIQYKEDFDSYPVLLCFKHAVLRAVDQDKMIVAFVTPELVCCSDCQEKKKSATRYATSEARARQEGQSLSGMMTDSVALKGRGLK